MANYVRQYNDVIQETEELYRTILALEESSRLELEKRNIIHDHRTRIPFEFINLHNLNQRLICFVINSHDNFKYLFGKNGIAKRDFSLKRKLLKVYLAAVCSMIKESFYHGTTTTFEQVTKLQFNSISNQYYYLLENAFVVEGVLPDDWNEIKAHRYKDVLINESGIPANLVSNIIKFFRIYWKYFKGCTIDKKKEFMENIKRNDYWDYRFQYRDLLEMKKLYDEIKVYPTKVLKILTQLEDIYFYIEDNDFEKSQLESEEFFNKASRDLGYDILTLIPNKRILKKLYEDMINKVSLGKFKRILKNSPREILITLPNDNILRLFTEDIDYLIWNT